MWGWRLVEVEQREEFALGVGSFIQMQGSPIVLNDYTFCQQRLKSRHPGARTSRVGQESRSVPALSDFQPHQSEDPFAERTTVTTIGSVDCHWLSSFYYQH